MQNDVFTAGQRIESVVDSRNYKIKKLIERLGLDIRLIGDRDNPCMILDNNIKISAMIKDNIIIFFHAPRNSKPALVFDLDNPMSHNTVEVIKEIINNSEHDKVYRIWSEQWGMYLVGVDYENRLEKKDPFPVMSDKKPKIFLRESNAKRSIKDFPGYNLQII